MKKIIIATLSVSTIFSACKDEQNTQKTNKVKPEKPAKPNVLFIAVDDLKPMLGCYGNTLIKTPNIDRMAKNGMLFQKNYCQVAVSGASRASLLTGMYADNTKVWSFDTIRKHNPDVTTLPQHFRNNGYTTINLGKIFDYRTVDKYSDSISWDYAFPVTEDDYYPYYNKQTGIAALYHYQSEYVKQKYQQYKQEALDAGKDTFRYVFQRISPATECLDVPDDAYKDGIFAKLGVQQINTLAQSNNPFFLAVGFHKPHLPFVAPKKYWDLYNRDDIQTAQNKKFAKNAVEFAYHTSNELRSYTDEKGNHIYDKLKNGKKLDAEEQKKLIHAYMATVSFVDAQIGKLLDALEKNQLTQNTIIVFWGDHGWHLGDHGMWGKASNFEQATAAPLIISAPQTKPAKINTPTEFVDIYPTLCELAGLKTPEHLDGQSLIRISKAGLQYDFAISQWPKGNKLGYAIRDGRYRYVEWIENGYHVNPNANMNQVAGRQLFDYKNDPNETLNLVNNPQYKEALKKMKQKLHQFYKNQRLTE